MAGHNKWSKVKHVKGKLDAIKARIFSRYSKEISVAAKHGGGDPNFNPRLRSLIDSARAENMPNDNIDRAIKKGTGELEGVSYEESTYEAYGPGGVALLIEVLTDNKNRAAQDIRHALSKNHGNLATPGSVSYLFQRKGRVIVAASLINEDDLMGVVLDAGAEDLKKMDEDFEIITTPDALEAVAESIRKRQIVPTTVELTYLPQTIVTVTEEETAKKVLQLVEVLDENDDVQRVHANFDLPEQILKA